MDLLLQVEQKLLSDLREIYRKTNHLDEHILQGLALFYGYECLLHAFHLLKQTNRLTLYQTNDGEVPRRLYQFQANKNQVSVYTYPTSHFCTCTFYEEHIVARQEHFACPHNIAGKIHQQLFSSLNEMEIETFEISVDYFLSKVSRICQMCKINSIDDH